MIAADPSCQRCKKRDEGKCPRCAMDERMRENKELYEALAGDGE